MSEETKTFSVKNDLLSAFKENNSAISAHTPDFINKIRTEAIAEFEKIGFPSKKDEKYKYTNIETAFFWSL